MRRKPQKRDHSGTRDMGYAMTIEEIAAALGMRRQNVAVTLHRALKKIQIKLARDNVRSLCEL